MPFVMMSSQSLECDWKTMKVPWARWGVFLGSNPGSSEQGKDAGRNSAQLIVKGRWEMWPGACVLASLPGVQDEPQDPSPQGLLP